MNHGMASYMPPRPQASRSAMALPSLRDLPLPPSFLLPEAKPELAHTTLLDRPFSNGYQRAPPSPVSPIHVPNPEMVEHERYYDHDHYWRQRTESSTPTTESSSFYSNATASFSSQEDFGGRRYSAPDIPAHEMSVIQPIAEYPRVVKKGQQQRKRHTMAEKARRKSHKHSFDVLRGMVPNCDATTSKDDVLKAVVKYVTDLQDQLRQAKQV